MSDRPPVAGAAVFFNFFRDDSFPLDSDRVGEPARFRDLPFFSRSPCFCLPCGVVAPLDPAALGLSLASAWPSLPSASFLLASFFSASFLSASFLSSSLFASSSSSLESSSDYLFG